jgi:hypothetical protein
VAGLASLAALVLTAGSGDVPLIAAQAVAAGAALCTVGLVLRPRNFGSVRAAEGSAGRGQTKDMEPPPHDLLDDKRWLRLVEELVSLLDELERHQPQFDPATRDLAGHVGLRVQEILERSGVTVIEGETAFDRSRHQPEQGAAHARAGAAVLETLRPGLAVGRRVLRRARVRLALGDTPADNDLPQEHRE